MVKMKNFEIGHEILFVQPLSEIPPNPPLLKGGQGGFLAGQWSQRKTSLLVEVLPS